jgi:chemotaxis protein methyltransferase CheR
MSYLSQPSIVPPQEDKLSDELFGEFRQFIYSRTGIFFADNKKYLLESRISRRLTALGMGTYDGYFKAVTNGQAAGELSHFINSITINETFYFRNEPQFNALECLILPELIDKRRKDGTNKIRIWSAACSTGDEPYTIAMIITEKMLPSFPQMKFEIIGTDINTQALDSAQRGIYKEYSVRNMPKNYLGKYFRKEEDRYFLSEEIKKMVEFKPLNLFDRAAIRTMRGFDVIFAANVLIYFDFNSKQTVVSCIYDSTTKGGYFFVGYSETLYGLTQAFKPVHFEKAIAYMKE